MSDEAWTRAALRVLSASLDPEQLTLRIGLPPTKAHAKGSLYSPRNPGSQRREVAVWTRDSGLSSGKPLEDHLNALEVLFRPHLESLIQISHEASIDIFIGITPLPGQSGLVIERSFIEMCAQIRAEIILDMYAKDEETES